MRGENGYETARADNVPDHKVQGKLDQDWSDWFRGLAVTFEYASDGSPVTTLAGPVVDQSALRGILNQIWDLNLTLLLVSRGGIQ